MIMQFIGGLCMYAPCFVFYCMIQRSVCFFNYKVEFWSFVLVQLGWTLVRWEAGWVELLFHRLKCLGRFYLENEKKKNNQKFNKSVPFRRCLFSYRCTDDVTTW